VTYTDFFGKLKPIYLTSSALASRLVLGRGALHVMELTTVPTRAKGPEQFILC